MIDDRSLSHDLARNAPIAQTGCGNRVEIASTDSRPVQRFAIGGQSDTVRAKSVECDLARGIERVDDFAPDDSCEAEFGVDLRDAVEVAPGFAGAEIDDDDTVAAFNGRVGDVCYALAGGGDARAEVEADVVDVLIWLLIQL